MSYPTNTKSVMKDIKAGYRRFVGHSSGWQSHKAKGCPQTCWYCLQARRVALDALVKEAQERGKYESS